MTKLSRILKDYNDSGAMNALIPIHAAIDDHTFLTKSGDLMTLVAVQGVDYECVDALHLDHIARRFESTLRTFDENFRLYQYLVKRDAPPIPHRTYASPVVQQAVANRIAYLQGKNLYSLDTYIAVVYLASKQAGGLHQGPRDL